MVETSREYIARVPRRALIWVGAAVLVVLSVIALRTAGGASAQEVQTAKARQGPIVVTVGGVGRIVDSAPPIQVFPRTAGIVSDVLVARGDEVEAGEVLVVLDDGGVAAAATDQARADLATAQLDLRQRQAARPADLRAARNDLKRAQADRELALGGSPAARQRALRVAEQNVQAAQARLDQLTAPPNVADVRAAQAEVRRTEAALAALLAPRPGPAPELVAAAQQAVVVARQNLARAQATGTPQEVNAAQLDLYRAQAELAALQQPAAAPLPQEVTAARAAVESAEANLARLYDQPTAAELTAARLEVSRARSELEQLRAGASEVQREAADEAVTSARGRLAQARAPFGIDLARQGVAGARARLAGALASEAALTVRAPTSGTVTALQVADGTFVDVTTAIATIATVDDVAVTVDLSEFDVAQVELGQKAAVSVDALGGEEFPGQVAYIAPSGTDTNGLVTFPVQVALLEAEDVKAGMSVSVRIVVARAAGVVLVPLEAVTIDDEDNASVVVLDESGVETERAVKVGLSNNAMIEIVKGLRPGEVVVLPEPAAAEEEE